MDRLSPQVEEFLEYACVPEQTPDLISVVKEIARKYTKKPRLRRQFQMGYKDDRRLLNFAIRNRHELLVDVLLNVFKANPNLPDHTTDLTSLHHAAIMGDVELIEDLVLEHNCSVQSLNICGSSPLHLALLCGETEVAEWLIDQGASMRVKNALGSPIHVAALTKNIDAIRRMYEKDHDIVNAEVDGFGPPVIAAICSPECLEFLAEVTELGGISLSYKAIACNSSKTHALKCLEVLVNFGADVNILEEDLYEELPIIYAAKQGWKDAIRMLLPETTQIPNVDWTVEGLLEYVASEGFRHMDQERTEMRVNQLKDKLLLLLRDRNYLAADLICKILYADMEMEAWDRYHCVYKTAVVLLKASYHYEITAQNMYLFARAYKETGAADFAITAAKASLAIEPDNAMYQSFYTEMGRHMSAASTSGR